jgi:selenide, water dikinase
MKTNDKSLENNSENQLTKLTANIKAAGCAAKISPAQLSEIVRRLPRFLDENLLTSIDTFEDAGVYKISDELAIIQTLDFFPPVVDDPFVFGKIAAVNALSDVYAMGGQPLLAMNILSFPVCDYPLDVAQRIVEGGAEAVVEAGAILVGGHSIQGQEPLYGLSVMGTVHPERIWRNSGAQDGDAVIIAKAIGTGASLLAHKGGVLSEAAADELFNSLTRSNRVVMEIATEFPIHAATDVTGFGLIGHLHEMSKASGFQAQLLSAKVPLLIEALTCAEQGLVPAGAYSNRKSYESIAQIDDSVPLALSDLLFDPQTAGGLLLAIENQKAAALEQKLREAGFNAAIIGSFKKGDAGKVEVT